MVKQVQPLEYVEVKKETAEYKPIVEYKTIQKNDDDKTVTPVVLKIKLYKYVLIAMSILLGFHLYTTVQTESVFLLAIVENPGMLEMINGYYEMQRKLINMAHIVTFLFCVLLAVVAGALYKIEFSYCEKRELKRYN